MKVFFFSLFCLLSAQNVAWAKQIIAVEVSGIEDKTLIELAKTLFAVEVGQQYDQSQIRLGLKRLVGSDAFASANVFYEEQRSGIRLVIEVIPEETIDSIDVLVSMPDLRARFESAIPLYRFDRYDAARIQKAKQQLLDLAMSMGYPQAVVNSNAKEVMPHQWRIVFDVQLGQQARIQKVQFVGQETILPSVLSDLLGIRENDPFDQKKIERGLTEIRQYLADQGYYRATATAGQDAGTLIVRISQGPRYQIHIRGAASFTARALLPVINQDLRLEPISARIFLRVKNRLKKFYSENGFLDTEVTVVDEIAEAREQKKGFNRRLVFHVAEGPQYTIAQFEFLGASQISKAELLEYVLGLLKPIGLADSLPAIDEAVDSLTGARRIVEPRSAARPGALAFNRTQIEMLSGRLLELYRERGFQHATIGDAKIVNLPHQQIRLSFEISENAQTIIREVEPIEQTSNLIGQPLNLKIVEEQRAKIETDLKDTGHPDAVAQYEVQYLNENRDAKIVFSTVPGPTVIMRDFAIAGNEATHQEVLADYLKPLLNKPYSRKLMTETRLKLLRLDLFSQVDLKFAHDGEAGHLELEVKEQPRLTAEVGVGASLEDGPRAIGQVYYRNLFGWALHLNSRIQANYPALFYDIPFLYTEKSVKHLKNRFLSDSPAVRALLYTEVEALISILYPKIIGFPIDTSASADLSARREIKPAYTLNKASTSFKFNLEPLKALLFGPEFEFEYANFDCVVDEASGTRSCGDRLSRTVARLDGGIVRQASLGLFASLDRIDRSLVLQNGMRARVSGHFGLGYADLMGVDIVLPRPIRYAKIEGQLGGFWDTTKNFSVGLTAQAGNIFRLGSDSYVPLFKRFYLGGTNTLRGFNEDQIQPADAMGPLAAVSEGGNFFVSGRAEVMFLVWKDLYGAVFFDVGELLENPINFNLTQMAASTGIGIRYQTIVGPLAVDLGIRLFDRGEPIISQFPDVFGLHFSIG